MEDTEYFLKVFLSQLPLGYVYLEQRTSWDVWAAGSSFSRLLVRSRVCRWMRPQGTTEGRAARQLDDRSRWVIRDETSMNQSSSNQGSCRPLQHTPTACMHACTHTDTHQKQKYFITGITGALNFDFVFSSHLHSTSVPCHVISIICKLVSLHVIVPLSYSGFDIEDKCLLISFLSIHFIIFNII